MVNKPSSKKISGLSIALSTKDRGQIDKAARILELPPSVWGRSELLKAANKIIASAAVASK